MRLQAFKEINHFKDLDTYESLSRDVKEIGCDNGSRVHLAENRFQLWDLVNMTVNLLVPKRRRIYLSVEQVSASQKIWNELRS